MSATLPWSVLSFAPFDAPPLPSERPVSEAGAGGPIPPPRTEWTLGTRTASKQNLPSESKLPFPSSMKSQKQVLFFLKMELNPNLCVIYFHENQSLHWEILYTLYIHNTHNTHYCIHYCVIHVLYTQNLKFCGWLLWCWDILEVLGANSCLKS